MSKLSAIKKQIAALEARAQRIAKSEMGPAIAKVKAIMAEFNLTVEHLTQAVTGKAAPKKMKARAASVAKYADPKTGKQWSGFGRAPSWIAGARNRDKFLIDKSATKSAEPIAKVPSAAKKTAAKAASKPATKSVAKKAAKTAVKNAAPAAKKAAPAAKKGATSAKKTALPAKKAAPTVATADSAGKKKPSAKKAGAKKAAPRKTAPKTSVSSAAPATAETSATPSA